MAAEKGIPGAKTPYTLFPFALPTSSFPHTPSEWEANSPPFIVNPNERRHHRPASKLLPKVKTVVCRASRPVGTMHQQVAPTVPQMCLAYSANRMLCAKLIVLGPQAILVEVTPYLPRNVLTFVGSRKYSGTYSSWFGQRVTGPSQRPVNGLWIDRVNNGSCFQIRKLWRHSHLGRLCCL